ncbi:hypothetical protein, partial [Bradyrhizobium yuanmingense]|uniref:hypothetical protein n=1 Tax=Bradyrhizobium yuanmingense TaxID=108015 RepID=UPI0023B98444
MAELVPPARPMPLRRGEGPAIYASICGAKNVDARDKPGHDEDWGGNKPLFRPHIGVAAGAAGG